MADVSPEESGLDARDGERPPTTRGADATRSAPPGLDQKSTVGLTPPPTDLPPLFGAFGRYQILAQLGRGAMGIVYKARDTKLGRLVALKTIGSGVLAAPAELERFDREAQAVAQLNHPHVIKILDYGQYQGQQYFTMTLAEGGSLSQHLERLRADPRSVAALVQKVADAVQHIHEHGLLHRDLKPGNILMEAAEAPLVSDFGLAKSVVADAGLTRTGAAVGTPAYMAPEQAAGRQDGVGPHTDVWALGVILYEIMTGRRPFTAATPDDVVRLILTTDPASPRSLQPSLPRDLETIVLKCLEKDPAKRYPSAGALSDDLGCWLRGEPIRARPPG